MAEDDYIFITAESDVLVVAFFVGFDKTEARTTRLIYLSPLENHMAWRAGSNHLRLGSHRLSRASVARYQRRFKITEIGASRAQSMTTSE